MGTRGLTMVKLGGKYRVAQYGQWDHYPSGQGLTALKFCRLRLRTVGGLKKFTEAVEATRFVTEDETKDMWKGIGVDIVKCDGWVACDKSDQFGKQYPSLHRDTGAKILELVLQGETRLQDDHEYQDSTQGFSCCGVYCVDLDAGSFKAYDADKLLKEWPLDKLPTQKQFLADLEPPDED